MGEVLGEPTIAESPLGERSIASPSLRSPKAARIHTELAKAIGANEGKRAADLMLSHLVDVLSGLDLRSRSREQARLEDVLAGSGR